MFGCSVKDIFATSNSGDDYAVLATFCVAPIVARSDQTRVLYWTWGSRNCCTPDAARKCWANYAPGTPLAGYAYAMRASLVQDEFHDARRDTNRKLAFNSTTGDTEATLNALPAVFIVLNAAPEATVDAAFLRVALVLGGVLCGFIVFSLAMFFWMGCSFNSCCSPDCYASQPNSDSQSAFVCL